MIHTLFTVLSVLFLTILAVFLSLAAHDEWRASDFQVLVVQGFPIKYIYNSALMRVLHFLSGGSMYAITIWNRVYVLTDHNSISATIKAHEAVHVLQWHRLGVFRFIFLYLRDLIRIGYVWHPMELEARSAVGESLGIV